MTLLKEKIEKTDNNLTIQDLGGFFMGKFKVPDFYNNLELYFLFNLF